MRVLRWALRATLAPAPGRSRGTAKVCSLCCESSRICCAMRATPQRSAATEVLRAACEPESVRVLDARGQHDVLRAADLRPGGVADVAFDGLQLAVADRSPRDRQMRREHSRAEFVEDDVAAPDLGR